MHNKDIVYNKSDTWYHIFVAARKPYKRTTRNNEPKGAQVMVIFWLIFAIVIIFVFMLNAQTIKKNFDLFMTRLTTSPGTEGDFQEEDDLSDNLSDNLSDETSITEQPAVSDRVVVITGNDIRTQTAEQERPAEQAAAAQSGAQPQTQGNTQSSAQTQTQTQQQSQAQAQSSAQIRERTVYFTQIDKDGQILQSKVTRRIPVSETPMTDVLNIILAGPSTDEINRGILNLIPKNTRLLNATVRGSTAYISFSEDFLFNTFGVEGYVAQLRQVVWTVTEFPNVADVQILVEGRRIDFLGEGIFIGSPISRQSF